MAGSVVSSAVLSKCGLKYTLVFGTLLLSSFSFGSVLSAWRALNTDADRDADQTDLWRFLDKSDTVVWTMIVTSALTGLGESIIWVA
jgi:hypothetical protein